MWLLFYILVICLLLTQGIINILKIWDHIEMIKTSKQTADILNDKLNDTFNCQCDGKRFKEEE